MTNERKAELFDHAISWIWEHTNGYGSEEYARALFKIGYTREEIENELFECVYDEDVVEYLIGFLNEMEDE
jgi:hypothetical protein